MPSYAQWLKYKFWGSGTLKKFGDPTYSKLNGPLSTCLYL